MLDEQSRVNSSETHNLPKISVVTITYNHQDFIKEAMDGVLMQEYAGQIEFVIANDCSSDNSNKVITEYLATITIPQNITIKYTNHPTNKGMIPNFVWAMQQTSGTYIAMCEGDDFWTDKLKLQKQVEFLEKNPKFILCGHQVNQLNFMGEIENKRDIPSIAFSQAEMFDVHIPTLSAVFRNLLKNIPQNIFKSPSGDRLLWAYLGKFGDYYIMGDRMATYRQHAGGVWSGVSETRQTKYSLISKILATKVIEDKSKVTVHNVKLSKVGIYQSLKKFEIHNVLFFSSCYVFCKWNRLRYCVLRK